MVLVKIKLAKSITGKTMTIFDQIKTAAFEDELKELKSLSKSDTYGKRALNRELISGSVQGGLIGTGIAHAMGHHQRLQKTKYLKKFPGAFKVTKLISKAPKRAKAIGATIGAISGVITGYGAQKALGNPYLKSKKG